MTTITNKTTKRTRPRMLAVLLCAAAMLVLGVMIGMTRGKVAAKAEETAQTLDEYFAANGYKRVTEPTTSSHPLSHIVQFSFTLDGEDFAVDDLAIEDAALDVVFSNYPGMPGQVMIWIPRFADVPHTTCTNSTVMVRNTASSEIAYEVKPGMSTLETYYAFLFNSNAVSSGSDTAPLYKVRYFLSADPGIPMPEDPVKEGHHFAGWYYDQEFTRPYDNLPIYEDTNLYAKFEINTYTVQYKSAGGTPFQSVTVDWNTAAPTPNTMRTGYDLVGWQLPDGTIYNGEGITQDTVLTAKWEIKRFDVTFYIGEEVYKTVKVEYGQTLQKAMDKAKISSYVASTLEGERISKQSIITENENVLVHKTHGWEKYGDWVGRNHWYTWLMLALGLAAAGTAAICIVALVRIRKG